MKNSNMPSTPIYDQGRTLLSQAEAMSAVEHSMATGFTKREELASRNMAAILANSGTTRGHTPRKEFMEFVAEYSLTGADALLREMEKEKFA